MDKFEELKKYKELLDNEIISQEEFDEKKKELLDPHRLELIKEKESSLDILERINGKKTKASVPLTENSSTSQPKKALMKKIIAIAVVVILVCLVIFGVSGGVKKDERILKSCLLNPSSLIVYDTYVNDDYGDVGATLFYFGAENKGGGITDDWALVYEGEVQFYSTYEEGKAEGDTEAILSCGDVIIAKTAVSIGEPAWKKVD